ncbi:MAG: DUF3313 family protein [Woeseiaceae bacterium]
MDKLFLAVVMSLIVGCASGPSIDQGPDAELTYDGLSPIRNSAFQRAWIDPEADLTRYNKILVGAVDFDFRTVSQADFRSSVDSSQVREFYITEENRAQLIETVSGAFREELGTIRSFTLTDQPGADTLVLTGTLLDIVSRVPPQRTGSGAPYLSSLGEATLVFELRDSLSGETLYRAADRQAIARPHASIRATRSTAWAEVRRWAQSWATRVRDGLDSIHE